MRLLFTSDWHVDAVTMGVARRVELSAYVDRLVEAVRREGVDRVVFCGDAFDPGSMLHPLYDTTVIHAFQQLAEASGNSVISIAGNHDVVEVGFALSTLTIASFTGGNILHSDVPSIVRHNDDLEFLLLPYCSRAWVDAANRGEIRSPASFADLAFASAADAREDGRDVIVVGHMTIPGVMLGSESVELARGRDFDLPIGRIRELDPLLVVNGHYHRPQIATVDGLEIVIPGSPLSFTTDDPGDEKGYVMVDL